MHRKHALWGTILLLLLAFTLVACGSEDAPAEETDAPSAETASEETAADAEPAGEEAEPDPTATSEPDPTATPEPDPTATPEPTATPDPAADFETFEDATSGITFRHPAGWALDPESGDGFFVFASDEAMFDMEDFGEELAFFAAVTAADDVEEGDLDDLVGWAEGAIASDFDGVVVDTPTPFDVDGVEAVKARFTSQVDGVGEDESVAFYVFYDGEQVATLLGVTALDAVDQWADTLDTVARTVELTGATTMAEADDSAETGASGAAVGLGGSGEAVSGPGLACFGTQGLGVSCIDADGAWQTFTTDNSGLGGDYITAMGTCDDGTMLIAHTSGLSLFDGANWSELDRGWGFSSPDGIACDADGGIWVAHFEGVSYYDGASWTTFESDLLATGDSATDLVEGVVVAPDGTIWVATANSVASYDGSEWTVYQEGQGFDDTVFIDGVALDSTGQPWVAYSRGLLQFDGSDWIEHENPSFLTANAVAVAPNDAVLIGTFGDGIQLFDGNWEALTPDTSDLSIERVQSLTFDDTGRAWIGTTWGLNVAADESDWVVYRLDNADLVDHDIAHIAVVGDGPAALPEPTDKGTGSMIGAVELNGAPSADSRVEICVQPLYSSFTGDTPCSDQPLFFQAVTDASGAFSFDDVPEGYYIIVFETDDGWAQITTEFGIGSERVPITAGEELDVGTLTLADE